MVSLRRAFRIFWIGLVLMLLVIPLLAFMLAKAAERSLRGERRVGEWTFQFHGARVSSLVNFRADSAVFQSPYERVFASGVSLSLLDWTHLWSRRAVIRLSVDSAEARLGKRPASGKPPVFPELSFPLPVTLEWRELRLLPPGGVAVDVEGAQWRSRGPWGLAGHFHARWENAPVAAADADVSLEAHWRGKLARYRVEARRGNDAVWLLGNRDKKALAQGEDSLGLSLADPRPWLPAAWTQGLPSVSRVRAAGKIDWRKRKISLAGEAGAGAFRVLEPMSWSWTLRSDARGGSAQFEGRGARQEVRARGEWSHPPEWLSPPDWNRYAGKFSAQSRGVRWQIGTRVLPLDFEIPELRLSPGRAVQGRAITAAGSSLDFQWDGDHPGKLDFAGSISSREPWALIWTDTNVSFRAARVQGTWEGKKVAVTAHLQGVRAFKNEADSVETFQEIVGPEGYYLRDARIYRQGQVFRGSGFVEWARHPGRKPPALAFEAWHPDFGRVRFTMPSPDSLIAEARDAAVAEFPYRPLWSLARFHPRVDGRFAWNPRGAGESDVSASFAYDGKQLEAAAKGWWNRDSLYVTRAELDAGAARLGGSATVGLHGLSLAGLARFNPDAVGTARFSAENVRIGEVLQLLRPAKESAPVDGELNGTLTYAAGRGWQGLLLVPELDVPALKGALEVKDVSLSGQGDGLLLYARSASARQPLLTDTLHANLHDLRSAAPALDVELRSGPLAARFSGSVLAFKELRGALEVKGRVPLGGTAGFLDEVDLEGDLSAALAPGGEGPRFASRRFQMRYAAAADTQWLEGQLTYAKQALSAPELHVRNARGGSATARFEARLSEPLSAHLDFSGSDLRFALPQGEAVQVRDLSGSASWQKGGELRVTAQAQSGAFQLPNASGRVESGFEAVRVEAVIPPADATALPKLALNGRLRGFLFQRRMGVKDIEAFFSAFRRKRGGGGERHSKPWEMDVQLEAVGSDNHVDTDVLRMTFLGDLEVKGVYPYTLFNGKFSGLQGEVGQSGQEFALRDFDVKWENAALDEGTVYLEGDNKVRADCEPNTERTCTISIKLNGPVTEMNFHYETDCGQNTGEPVPFTVLVNWTSQGCATEQISGGSGDYKNAVFNMIDPTINNGISKGVKSVGLGGIIGYAHVSGVTSGFNSWVARDTSGLEPLTVEMRTKEKYRVSLAARYAYHPEVKLVDPHEYKVGLEYRPPLEKAVSDSIWRERFRDRWTLETSVETRPPADVQNVEEQREVHEKAGLRYHYHFWNWW